MRRKGKGRRRRNGKYGVGVYRGVTSFDRSGRGRSPRNVNCREDGRCDREEGLEVDRIGERRRFRNLFTVEESLRKGQTEDGRKVGLTRACVCVCVKRAVCLLKYISPYVQQENTKRQKRELREIRKRVTWWTDVSLHFFEQVPVCR